MRISCSELERSLFISSEWALTHLQQAKETDTITKDCTAKADMDKKAALFYHIFSLTGKFLSKGRHTKQQKKHQQQVCSTMKRNFILSQEFSWKEGKGQQEQKNPTWTELTITVMCVMSSHSSRL